MTSESKSDNFIDNTNKPPYIPSTLNNVIIDKSIIAGVERDTISFDTLESIFNGSNITVNNKIKFHKSLNDLSIKLLLSTILGLLR